MVAKKQTTQTKTVKPKEPRSSKPAETIEAREKQLVNLAVNLAERQLKEGTASAAVITHYLKLGTTREMIEREILEEQKKLTKAKADSISKGSQSDNVAQKAIDAMKKYSGDS